MGSGIYYSVPYIVIFFLLLFLYRLELAGKRDTQIIAFLILLIFIGLRGFVYTDFIVYYTFFDNLPLLSDLHFDSLYSDDYEFGFVFYSSFIKTIYPNYFFWVFVNSLIDLLVIFWLFRKYSYSVILSYIVFLGFSGLLIEFNLYRNSKAMILFFLSIPYLKERKILPYMCINLFATLFHLSAFIYLPLYFVLTKEIPKYIVWSIFVIITIIVFCHISISGFIIELIGPLLGVDKSYDKLVGYLSRGDSFGLSFGYIERTFAFILFTLFSGKMFKQNSCNRIFYNCFILYYVIFHLFLDVKVLTERIPLLFIFAYWILYSNILCVLAKNNNIRLLKICIIGLCLYKLFVGNTNIFTKYDNLIFGIESYEERKDIFKTYMDNLI